MRRLPFVVAALALVLTACGGGGASYGATNATTAPAAAADGIPAALRFTVDRVGGGTIDAASYAGRPVAFWFWAPT